MGLLKAISDFFAPWFRIVIDFFVVWFRRIFEFLEWIVVSILSFFWNVIDYIIGMAWNFGYYLYDLLLGEDGFVWYPIRIGFEWLNNLIWMIPPIGDFADDYVAEFSYVMCLVGALDKFFPLTESYFFLNIFMYFLLMFIIVKYIWKLIPGTG